MTSQNHTINRQTIPTELNNALLGIINSSPGLSTSLIQLLYTIARMAFVAGIDAGMNAAIDRIEITNTKLQSLVH